VIALLIAAGVSMVFTLVLTPLFAKAFRRMNLGQFFRADTPTTHVVKRGTPSMGGVIFIVAAVLGYFVGKLVGHEKPSTPAMLVLLMMVGLGSIGFIDDFMKVRRNNSLGLSGPFKIVGTLIVGSVFALLALAYSTTHGTAATTSISFVRDLPGFNLALLFGVTGVVIIVLWIAIITTAVSNAVNLADGLDGLAAGSSIIAFGGYIAIGFWQFKQACGPGGAFPADQFRCYPVAAPLDLAVVAAAIVGAVLGFLWWNTSPAQIIMGDTGSFGLGGAMAALAVLSHTELLLVLMGGLFMIVTGQVIIQRIYFKLTRGKRIWRASPLHHHFEMKGWAEVTIVVRFWIISGLFVSTGVGVFYLEWLSHRP
jgi:phospho-N-acetylmuramoyl-pentapeptide-transferase